MMERLNSAKPVVPPTHENPPSIFSTLSDWAHNQGGVAGIVDKIQTEILPLKADEIVKILGNETVEKLAAKMGIEASEVGRHLAELLPLLAKKKRHVGF